MAKLTDDDLCDSNFLKQITELEEKEEEDDDDDGNQETNPLTNKKQMCKALESYEVT